MERNLRFDDTKPASPLVDEPFDSSEIVYKWAVWFDSHALGAYRLPLASYSIFLNSRMRTRAGVCYPHDRKIQLNPNILVKASEFEETLVHEMCHLAVIQKHPRSAPHGKLWRDLMTKCGFKASRCHKIDTEKLRRPQKKHRYVCICREHFVSTRVHMRLQKGWNYSCKKCRKELAFDAGAVGISTEIAKNDECNP